MHISWEHSLYCVACADLHREKKSERHWLFTPPLTIYKRTAIRRLPTARNSKTVSFFRRWQQCSSSFGIWSREPRCGGFALTSGSKSKNSLKNVLYRFIIAWHQFVIVCSGGQALTCKSSFDMLICACNTAFILSRNYMHAWHAVPSCKWNKDEKTPMQGDRRISVIGASIARPRECVWANSRFCCWWVRGSGRR